MSNTRPSTSSERGINTRRLVPRTLCRVSLAPRTPTATRRPLQKSKHQKCSLALKFRKTQLSLAPNLFTISSSITNCFFNRPYLFPPLLKNVDLIDFHQENSSNIIPCYQVGVTDLSRAYTTFAAAQKCCRLLGPLRLRHLTVLLHLLRSTHTEYDRLLHAKAFNAHHRCRSLSSYRQGIRKSSMNLVRLALLADSTYSDIP